VADTATIFLPAWVLRSSVIDTIRAGVPLLSMSRWRIRSSEMMKKGTSIIHIRINEGTEVVRDYILSLCVRVSEFRKSVEEI
jgi:hypothetical protein